MYKGDPTVHQCRGTTTRGEQCKRTAERGKVLCDTHGYRKKSYIQIQQRCDYNGLYPRNNFRAWRKFSVWPILFDTDEDARKFMDECFTFRGINGRKMSASIKRTRRTFPVEVANLFETSG